jgi:hypothetical protein
MMPNESRPRQRAASKTVNETGIIVSRPADTLRVVAQCAGLPPAWHEITEYEAGCAYHDGYRRGLRDAAIAFTADIEAAIGPAPESAKAVVRQYLAYVDRTGRAVPEPVDDGYAGGPVEWARVAA